MIIHEIILWNTDCDGCDTFVGINKDKVFDEAYEDYAAWHHDLKAEENLDKATWRKLSRNNFEACLEKGHVWLQAFDYHIEVVYRMHDIDVDKGNIGREYLHECNIEDAKEYAAMFEYGELSDNEADKLAFWFEKYEDTEIGSWYTWQSVFESKFAEVTGRKKGEEEKNE